jgi:hypothetical protein
MFHEGKKEDFFLVFYPSLLFGSCFHSERASVLLTMMKTEGGWRRDNRSRSKSIWEKQARVVIFSAVLSITSPPLRTLAHYIVLSREMIKS